MSAGGEGVTGKPPFEDLCAHTTARKKWTRRYFKLGGRLRQGDEDNPKNAPSAVCVLCGHQLGDEETNLEHPLPQWLHRFAGEASETRPVSMWAADPGAPSWRQLCLASHKSCNSSFDLKIERPAMGPFKAIARGARVSRSDLDRVFDWFDKVMSSSVHMGVALTSHRSDFNYRPQNFPDYRVGLYDRLGIFFRMTRPNTGLELGNILSYAFLSTPSAIVLQVGNLGVVYASNNHLLSSAFGLGHPIMIDGEVRYAPGSGIFSLGFGDRITRLPAAKIIAQPMRRLQLKHGLAGAHPALDSTGCGKVFELSQGGWHPLRSTSFAELPMISGPLALGLAALESLEWLMLMKERDNIFYPKEGQRAFMATMPRLRSEKAEMVRWLTTLRGGLPLPLSDRP